MDNLNYLDTIEHLCTENGKLQAIIESSTNGIIEINDEGEILTSNPAFYQMLNINPQKKEKLSLGEILSSDDLTNDLKNLITGNEDLLVKGFHVSIDVDDIAVMKYLEVKFSRVPVLNNFYIIGIVKDKSDIMRALLNRE